MKQCKECKFYQMALYDPLTGLVNKLLFQDRLNQSVLHFNRYKKCFGLIIIDLDKFKFINDKFGHLVGDKVLKTTASRLRKCIRICDTAARIGGDEFAVIIYESKLVDIPIIINRIIKYLTEPVYIQPSKTIEIKISVGTAFYPTEALTIEQLIIKADKRMYENKSNKQSH